MEVVHFVITLWVSTFKMDLVPTVMVRITSSSKDNAKNVLPTTAIICMQEIVFIVINKTTSSWLMVSVKSVKSPSVQNA